ncbi:MAG: hypothetical protein WA220_12355, partial [Candidatus Nitrosopolaris sp.]
QIVNDGCNNRYDVNFFCTQLYISPDQLLSMPENLIVYPTVGISICTGNSLAHKVLMSIQ